MLDTIVWLWCMWRVRRKYHELEHHKRCVFLDDLRPMLSEYDMPMSYPDAIFYIKPADIKKGLDFC